MTRQTCNSPSVPFISFNSIFRRSPCTRFGFSRFYQHVSHASFHISFPIAYFFFVDPTYSSHLHLCPLSQRFRSPILSLVGGMSPVPVTRAHHATIIHHDSSLMTQSKLQLIIIISPIQFNSSSPPDSTRHYIPRLQLIIITSFNSSSFRHQHSVNISVPTTKTVPSSASVVPGEFNVSNSGFKHLYFPSNSVQFPAEFRKFRSQIPVRLQQRRDVGTPATPLRIATSVRLLEINIRPNNS